MKTTAQPPQQPPLVAPCPWCEWDITVDADLTHCDACDVDLHIAPDRALAAAA